MNIIHSYRNDIARNILLARLKNKNFSIISDDCYGGSVYRELGLQYTTPFVGLFILAPCYLKLLSNLNYYLQSDLLFQQHSKYPEVECKRLDKDNNYPLGVLGDEIEIHFLHYDNPQEAHNKWHRRIKRINFSNLFVKFSGHINLFEYCTDRHIQDFAELGFDNKICFVLEQKWKNLEHKDILYVEKWLHSYPEYHAYFDLISWLNGNSWRISPQLSALNRILYYRSQGF